MNKIICDICGTDYPETAPQCPICGCANAGGLTLTAQETGTGREKAAYTYVKGGRFSKSNVRKRLQSNLSEQDYLRGDEDEDEDEDIEQFEPRREANVFPADIPEYDDGDEDEEEDDDDDDYEDDQPSNRGLIITVIILFAAIIALVVYLAVWVLGLGIPLKSPRPTTPQSGLVQETPATESPTASTAVPCTSLTLSDKEVSLQKPGDTWQLEVEFAPSNTTDTVIFTSNHEDVVTVDENGLLTCVNKGIALITVTCGDVKAECTVSCETEAVTEPPEVPDDFELELDKEEFTLLKAGATCEIYSGELGAEYIKWTSEDESIVTIENGVVTAVGNGSTTVHGEFEDQKVSCKVHCDLPEDEEPTEEPTGEDEDPTEETTEAGLTVEGAGDCELLVNGRVSPYGDAQNADVDISVNESFELKLVDEDRNVIDVDWKVNKEGIVDIDGTTITGAAKGTVKLTTIVNGVTYTCIVRV